MSVTSVQVTNFPGQISQDEFGKLFSRLDGFLGCRIIRTGNAEYDRLSTSNLVRHASAWGGILLPCTQRSSITCVCMCRLVGYIDFRDISAANNATSIYNGWRGWSAAGLIMKTMQPLPTGGLPIKRSREGPGMGCCIAHHHT